MIAGDAIAEEKRRIRYLRAIVDLTYHVLAQGTVSRSEGERLVEATRRKVLALFPGKEATYDLIYKPRFARLLRELPSVEPDGSESAPPRPG